MDHNTEKAKHSEGPDRHQKELLKGGASAFAARLLGMVLNTIFAIMLGRGFGTSGTGIYSVTQNVINFFGTIGKLGSDLLLTRFTAKFVAQDKWGEVKALYNQTILLAIPLCIALSITMYFLSSWIAVTFFQKPELVRYFHIGALAILPLTIFAITNGGLRGLKRSAQYSFLQNASFYAFGIFILGGFMIFTKSDSAPVYTMLIFIILSAMLSVYWWLKYSHYMKIPAEKGASFAEKFSIGFSIFIGSLASMIRGYADSFILGRFGTIAAVGIYRNAFRVSTFTRISLTAILVPADPKFAELYAQGKMKELAKAAQFATKLIFWTSVPLLIIMLLVPGLIMSIFGEGFRKGSTALSILACGQFINAATGPVSSLLNMTGKQKVVRNLMVIATIVVVILDWWLIPLYGATGAAFVSTTGTIIMNVIPFFFIRYYYGFYTLDIVDILNVNPNEIIKGAKQFVKIKK